jgi:hypothetical protein
VHAENNYWGTPTGPAPYGTGSGISYHTQCDPITGLTTIIPDIAVECWIGEPACSGQLNGPTGNGGSSGGNSGNPSTSPDCFYCGDANNDTVSAGEPVNTATGSYEYSHTDLSLAGRTPLVFSRSYNSRTAADSPGPLGYGWTFTYGATLSVSTGPAGNQVLVTFGSGRTACPPAPGVRACRLIPTPLLMFLNGAQNHPHPLTFQKSVL